MEDRSRALQKGRRSASRAGVDRFAMNRVAKKTVFMELASAPTRADATSVGEVSPAQSVYHWLAVVTVSADELISVSAIPTGEVLCAMSILTIAPVTVMSARMAAFAYRITRACIDATAPLISRVEIKRGNCASIDCGPGACVSATVPFCECPPNYAGSRCEIYEDNLRASVRIDVLLISVAILFLAVFLAVISVLIRYLCEKLELIQRGGPGPIYSTHWFAAEVHVRGRRSRSPSPPPLYDTGQKRLAVKSWRKESSEFFEEATV
ncbi:hypothetical protein OESDEN_07933 [Oesophagostomum dentatum]|uniref:EGF-like domain-containing protein n=1 Tax=Oesophagostomum dentatum TaxID=61180 RepID=A0A0B1T3S1_OESDE|nr:hypothetical protein OESDEN_07933 [Oesophagostomum dentatum]